VPFARFEGLHFARFILLDGQPTDDITVYGLLLRAWPVALAFLGDCHGAAETFLRELVFMAGDELRRLFFHCRKFDQADVLLHWMKAHN
jgi:hypothetical protein